MNFTISHMKTSKIFFIAFIILCFCYAAFLFFMLPYYVLFTTDEVFMASVAQSFVETGDFIPKSCTVPNSVGENVTVYGFVYFSIAGFVTKYLSNSLLAYRSVSYFFMWACLAISYLFIRKESISKKLSYWFVALFVTDQLFTNIVMTGVGRMNSLALFLLLSAIYSFYYEPIKTKNILTNSFCAAILLTLSLLTTPRMFMLLPLCLVVIHLKYRNIHVATPVNNETKKSETKNLLLKSINAMIFVLVTYSLWILYAFGSIDNLYRYYFSPRFLENNSNQSIVQYLFLGKSLHINFEYVPVFLTLLILGGYTYIKYRNTLTKNYSFFALFATVFFLFFGAKNLYLINLLPFSYIFLILLAQPLYDKSSQNTKIINILFTLLLLCNSSILGYRTLKSLLFIDLKNEKTVVDILKNTIPPNTSVLASDIYYYTVLESELNYQIFYIGYHQSPQARLIHHLENIQPQYLILSERLTKKQQENLDLYKKYYNIIPYKPIQLTDSLSMTNAQKMSQKVSKLFGSQLPQSYEGMIYKLQKKI